MSKKTKTKKSIGPAGASIVSDDGMKIKTKTKNKKEREREEIIERFADGGEVSINNSPNSGLITTKGFGASRAT